MESLAVSSFDYINQVLRGRKVFVTGHTGFKGSWLTVWLHHIGCEVAGYALPPATESSLFVQGRLDEFLAQHHLSDVRDAATLERAMQKFQPEVVIHMAAQPLVRQSYRVPRETWETNVLGTVNLLEAVRGCTSVRAVLVITTDKCYENREWPWGYREIDPLGGHDPYSASKAGSELVVQSYRKSFFGPSERVLLASARAGNVIGGGDWSADRLIPDAARAVAAGQSLVIRSPHATRPWQHVLGCLHGYLLLAAKLLDGWVEGATAFNFGPAAADNLSVGAVLERLQIHWPELSWQLDQAAITAAPHEAGFLYLDSSLARGKLAWEPCWSLDVSLERTAAWYRHVLNEPKRARSITQKQLED